MRINRRAATPIVLLAALAASQVGTSSAFATDFPVEIAFTSTSTTVEYGEYWSIPVSSDFYFFHQVYGLENAYEVVATSTPNGFTPELYMYYANPVPLGYLSAPYNAAPLGAGTYTFTIVADRTDISDDHYAGATPTPATLTVQKAALGVELRVVGDPTASDSMIVTARFTGRFVDEYQSSFFPSAALSPAGVWHIAIVDENGELATERNVERSAGDDNLATSFYWTDAEPGVKYTASAEFVPSGSSANNFTVAPAQDFGFTGAESARPTPLSTATGKPSASLPQATEFGLPLWSVILLSVLIAALVALVTVLSVRLSRRAATGSAEVAS